MRRRARLDPRWAQSWSCHCSVGARQKRVEHAQAHRAIRGQPRAFPTCDLTAIEAPPPSHTGVGDRTLRAANHARAGARRCSENSASGPVARAPRATPAPLPCGWLRSSPGSLLANLDRRPKLRAIHPRVGLFPLQAIAVHLHDLRLGSGAAALDLTHFNSGTPGHRHAAQQPDDRAGSRHSHPRSRAFCFPACAATSPANAARVPLAAPCPPRAAPPGHRVSWRLYSVHAPASVVTRQPEADRLRRTSGSSPAAARTRIGFRARWASWRTERGHPPRNDAAAHDCEGTPDCPSGALPRIDDAQRHTDADRALSAFCP